MGGEDCRLRYLTYKQTDPDCVEIVGEIPESPDTNEREGVITSIHVVP